jgi:hypothetical protein
MAASGEHHHRWISLTQSLSFYFGFGSRASLAFSLLFLFLPAFPLFSSFPSTPHSVSPLRSKGSRRQCEVRALLSDCRMWASAAAPVHISRRERGGTHARLFIFRPPLERKRKKPELREGQHGALSTELLTPLPLLLGTVDWVPWRPGCPSCLQYHASPRFLDAALLDTT